MLRKHGPKYHCLIHRKLGFLLMAVDAKKPRDWIFLLWCSCLRDDLRERKKNNQGHLHSTSTSTSKHRLDCLPSEVNRFHFPVHQSTLTPVSPLWSHSRDTFANEVVSRNQAPPTTDIQLNKDNLRFGLWISEESQTVIASHASSPSYLPARDIGNCTSDQVLHAVGTREAHSAIDRDRHPSIPIPPPNPLESRRDSWSRIVYERAPGSRIVFDLREGVQAYSVPANL
ncbi:uncharacterized protein N7496_002225 [Penicillium cataractarum]|uniref:Uncharacterized protein n=1 Tax=Penicillium cataractarum TaxID=2100454 RepID=A0A9W9VF79_9EURO|nr:uncharacterized protein N7496_002225 [Penicillium cataractarum]KAJ5379797.1 hypothetical protein N7496_002225 [Penicillium cataractarum]